MEAAPIFRCQGRGDRSHSNRPKSRREALADARLHDPPRRRDTRAPSPVLSRLLHTARALNMGETGWRTAGERRALWGMFDQCHAYFAIEPGRHEDHAK